MMPKSEIDMEKRIKIPSRDEYKQMITFLIEKNSIKTLKVLRMGAELGMSRIEIANARLSDLDRFHKRGLWIEIAKKVRRNTKFEMRSREIPVNPSLYQLLKTSIVEGDIFIISRDHKRGNPNVPLKQRYINTMYDEANISWSTHKSRHFFKDRLMDWMRTNRQVDMGLVKELMGHKKTVDEDYGSYSWDYKLDVIDKVFQ